MKNQLLFVLIIFIGLLKPIQGIGQDQPQSLTYGFELSPGWTLLWVDDSNPSRSGVDITADGSTERLENQGSMQARFIIDLAKGQYAWSSGLWFTQKKMRIQNRDGNYLGSSNYEVWYLQIPALFKKEIKSFSKGLSLSVFVGPSFDFKFVEKLNGPDLAHFWNLSRNRFDLDPSRGRNGNGEAVQLFNPLDISLHLGAGISYVISDGLSLYGGISGSKSFFNMINPRLQFNDANNTKVRESLSFTSGTFSFDLGLRFQF